MDRVSERAKQGRVLIESDWNLKYNYCTRYANNHYVLIESDWNLKTGEEDLFRITISINRIRLEFKAAQTKAEAAQTKGINRIRLEFKVKEIKEDLVDDLGINRIRLEFKD